MKNKIKTFALIPARGGSKGIIRKNIKLFNSKPLIYWSIKAALESNFIDRVIVSTEDDEIAEIAKSFSAEVPFKRPKKFAEDHSSGIEPVLHALENLTNVKNILLMQPTSPLRRTSDIDGIFKFRSCLNAESAVSVSVSKKNINLYFDMDLNNRIYPYSSDMKILPRQQYRQSYNLNGSLYLSTKESLMNHKSFISSDTVGYIMPEEYSIDIDTPLDWDIAEFLMKKLV